MSDEEVYIIMAEMKNILITSAGKRVELVKEFKETVNMLNLNSKVYTTELNPQLAPAAYVSDGCKQVPRVTADGYIDFLLQICSEWNVGLVVPTIDTELKVLAENKMKFDAIGCQLLVSEVNFVDTCRDKRLIEQFFVEHNVRIPEKRDKENPVFPMFAKPYDGSLSIDTFVLHGPEDMTSYVMEHPKLMFMEYIDKKVYREYTVDMYYGRDHHVKGIVPRERIEIRAGEINKGVTQKNDVVSFLRERMEYLSGVIGCVCLQLFYHPVTHDIVGIEINPRFGGGYPLSYAAGANFPEYAIREYLLGEKVEYRDDWKNKTLMLRYDAAVIVPNAEL